MQFLQCAVCLTIAILELAIGVRAAERSAPVLVRGVVSGDTLDIAAVGHLRLAGIRAPRSAAWSGGSEPYAEDARRRLAALATGRWVRLERTSGRAGRNAGAYVWTEDGVLLNALMLREGLAQLSTSGRVARADELAAAEADARSARRGIWSGGAGTARQPDAVIRKGRGGTRKPPARNSGQLTPNLVSCQLTTSSRSVCA